MPVDGGSTYRTIELIGNERLGGGNTSGETTCLAHLLLQGLVLGVVGLPASLAPFWETGRIEYSFAL